MAIIREGVGPYAPTEAVMTVIDGYRSKHPHVPFTAENIQPLGVAESLAPRTIQALRLLDLLDDEGNPTETMNQLREASSGEFPEILGQVVRAAYAEIFRYVDPTAQNADEINEQFRFYRPPSMQPRMVRLFYGLCARAKIIDEIPAINSKDGNAASRRSAAPRKAKTPPAPKPKSGSSQDPNPKPNEPRSLDNLKATYIELLMKRLSESSDGFDTDLADRIERLMGVSA